MSRLPILTAARLFFCSRPPPCLRRRDTWVFATFFFSGTSGGKPYALELTFLHSVNSEVRGAVAADLVVNARVRRRRPPLSCRSRFGFQLQFELQFLFLFLF